MMNNFLPLKLDVILPLLTKKTRKSIASRGHMVFLRMQGYFQCVYLDIPSEIKLLLQKEMIKLSFDEGSKHIFSPLLDIHTPFILAKIGVEDAQSLQQPSSFMNIKGFQSLLAFSIFFDERCLGFIVCVNPSHHNYQKRVLRIRKRIRPLLPLIAEALEIYQYQELRQELFAAQKKMGDLNAAIRQLNQLSTNPYRSLMKQILGLFPFNIAYLLLEKNNKLHITEGYATNQAYEAIYKRLYNYFCVDENKPAANKPETALSVAFMTKKHYYFADAQTFIPYEIWKDRMEEYPAGEKDRKAIAIIDRKLRTILHMPIIEGEKSVGILELLSLDENVVQLETDEIQMIANLASFIPSILRNLELYDKIDHMNNLLKRNHSQLLEELRLAQTIQQSLIPSKPPEIPGIRLASLYKPMEDVGGDFFDFVKVREPHLLGIFISDVSGHGVPAALITSMVKTLVETAGEKRVRPKELLGYMNDKLIGQTGGNFLTAFYGVYDTQTRVLTYARGAHNAPFLMRGSEIFTLESRGKMLGLLENLDFEEKEIELHPGDKLLFYTDGLTEAANAQGLEFEEIMPEILQELKTLPAGEFLDQLYHALLNHREEFNFEDDVCVVVMDVEE